MEQNKVIVIGGNHHNTLGVVRSLGYKGMNTHLVVVTNSKKPYICYSKYIRQYKVIETPDEIVNYLLKIKNKNKKSVIVSCADFVTAQLYIHQEKLSKYYYLPIGKGNILEVMNKDTMGKIANKCGILTPRNVSIENIAFSNNEKYIFKPLKSIEGTKADIEIIHNREELDNVILSSHCIQYQIQELIDKELEFQLIGCSINNGEVVIIPGVSIILRQPENTNTGFLEYVSFDEFQYNEIESCKKFIQTIGYSGLFSMEFLRGKDGKDYFMEINMRNDGNSICVTAAGVNLPYIWVCYCLGSMDWKIEALKKTNRVIVMPEFDDFVNVLKHKISLYQWFKDFRKTNCFMEYDKTDKKPYFIGMKQQIYKYVKLVIKKLHITK